MVGMDDTIRLDRRSFEALAADSRVRILKSLGRRRKTLTELARELNLSNSTMKEHLGVLVKAGLIIQKDEGRKWKYYELTRKGQGIVNPYPARVLIMLAVSMLLVVGSGWNFMNAYGVYSSEGQPGAYAAMADAGAASGAGTEEPEMQMAEGKNAFAVAQAAPSMETGGEEGPAPGVGAEFQEEPAGAAFAGIPFPWFEAVLMGLSVCILLLSLYYAKKGFSSPA